MHEEICHLREKIFTLEKRLDEMNKEGSKNENL